MKAGVVASIRVNPRDCQSVLDVMDKSGINTTGMSFASMTALAFSSLLETARQSGIIPEPDEFQYLNRMQPYLGKVNRKKLEITKTINSLGPALRPAALAPPEPVSVADEAPPIPPAASASETPESREMLRHAQQRLTELLAKKDWAEEDSSITWSEQDEREYQQFYRIVYPQG